MSWLMSLLQWLFLFFYLSHAEQIFYDEMNDLTAANWTTGGNVVVPSSASQCNPQYYCFELNRDGWVERTFSTQGYHTVYFRVNTDADNYGTIDIKVYNLDFLITDTGKSIDIIERFQTVTPSSPNQWDDISFFKIRFAMEQQNTVWIDRLEIFGVPITSSPTGSTTYPTTALPSIIPTAVPTSNPTINPTIDPTINPSIHPTIVPSINPTINPTMYPTIAPTTMNPSMNPTQQPTNYNVTPAVDDNEQDVDNEVTTTDVNDANSKDKYTKQSDAILSDKYLITHWYYLAGVAVILLCLLCTIAIFCSICRNKKVLKHMKVHHDQTAKETILNQASGTANGVIHIDEIALQKIEHVYDEQTCTSLPSTLVTIVTSPSPSPQPMFAMVATPNGLTEYKNDNRQQCNNILMVTDDGGEVHNDNHNMDGLAKSSHDEVEEFDDDGLYGSPINGMNENYIQTKGQTLGAITAGVNGMCLAEDTDTDEGSEDLYFSDDNIQANIDIVQNKNITAQ